MIEKLLLITSILLNTVGLRSQSLAIDKNIISEAVNPSNKVEASINLALPEITIKPRIDSIAPKPIIYTKSHILVDEASGTVLSSEEPNLRLPIASTTKIMTGILVLENYDLDEVITISKEAASQIGVDLQTITGEKITVGNLLHLLLINSSNRAAYALAEHLNTGSDTGPDKFVDLMNKKAKELGMKNTEYHDPAGLDVTGYSTAYDLYLATKYALKDEQFAEIVGTKDDVAVDLSGKIKYELHNSNRLVREWNYAGAIGVKTGYMPEASHTLVGAVKRNNHTLISVVLYTFADTVDASALESRKLFDWAFKYAKWGTESNIEPLETGTINSTNSTSGTE